MAGRSFQITATPVTVFAHLTAIAITTLVLVWLLHFRGGLAFKSVNKQKILNLHVFLMAVGFILFGGEAIMAYKTIPGRKYSRKVGHMLLHLTALAAGILGVSLAFKFHREISLPDVVSLHSWLGVTAISLYALQWVLGFLMYLFPGGERSRRAASVPWHVYSGMFIFLVAVCTAETGLLQRFNALSLGRSQEGLILNFAGILIILFAASVALSVILPRRSY